MVAGLISWFAQQWPEQGPRPAPSTTSWNLSNPEAKDLPGWGNISEAAWPTQDSQSPRNQWTGQRMGGLECDVTQDYGRFH